jgi:putative DNA primase/helicase
VGDAVCYHLRDRAREAIAGTSHAEKSGILNWLIEGALRWKREGLNVPALITNATDEYRGEMDVIGNFLQERCVQKPGAAIRARELFQVYQDWCDENNEMATSERMFGIHMKELGMVQKRTSKARFWQDLAMRPYSLNNWSLNPGTAALC